MIFVIILLVLLGLSIGSFLNVVIYRMVHEESFVSGRSKCPHCKKTIAWYDNIPLVSYFILKGRCRHCRKPISWRYPVIETITAFLFVWWYFIGFAFFKLSERPLIFIQPIFWLIVGICLILVMFSDLFFGIIPDGVLVVLTGIAVVYRSILFYRGVMQPVDFWLTLAGAIGACAFLGSLWLITKKKGMGFGDVKYAFPMGLLLGWPGIAVGMFLSFISGAVVGVVLIAAQKKKIKQTIPFGPFLVLGTFITLVFGNALLSWYLGMLQ